MGYMLRGFASNFPQAIRGQIAQQIYSAGGSVDRPPVDLSRNPLDFLITGGEGTNTGASSLKLISPVPSEFSLSSDFTDLEEPPVSRTIGLQRDVEVLRPWVFNAEPFIVCGSEGCGKSLVIRAAFDELKKTEKIQMAIIYCNAQTTAAQVIQKLNQVCSKGGQP